MSGRCRDGDTFLGHINHQLSLSLAHSCAIDTRSHSLLFVSVPFMRGRKWARRGVLEAPPLRLTQGQTRTDSLTVDDFLSQSLLSLRLRQLSSFADSECRLVSSIEKWSVDDHNAVGGRVERTFPPWVPIWSVKTNIGGYLPKRGGFF